MIIFGVRFVGKKHKPTLMTYMKFRLWFFSMAPSLLFFFVFSDTLGAISPGMSIWLRLPIVIIAYWSLKFIDSALVQKYDPTVHV